MLSKIQNFVEHNRMEQAERVAGRIPNYDQYMYIRYGVTGVRMFSLLLEYVRSFFPSRNTTCGLNIKLTNAVLKNHEPIQAPIKYHGLPRDGINHQRM